MQMQKTKKLALCAILSALGVLILFIGSVIDVLSMTMAGIGSLLIMVVMIEVGSPWPWLVWGVTSVLSMVLLPNKLPAIMYLLICGIYPIFKEKFERLHYVVAWVLKLSVFNTGLLLMITASKYIFYLSDSGMEFTLPVILIGNAAFILYDVALTQVILLYLVKLRSHMGLKNYFKN